MRVEQIAHRTRRRGGVGRSLAVVVALGLAAALFAPVGGEASSHREAPLVSADPQIDNTDVYAFTSPDDPATVTLISSWIPFEEPAGGPNFYPFSNRARYDIDIDNDGDARADVIYRWKFSNHYRNRGTFLYNTGQVTSLDDPDLNFYQTYNLSRVVPGGRTRVLLRNARVAPSDVGAGSMPDYGSLRDEAVETYGVTKKSFAGQSDDPFFLDLRVFDLLYGGDFSEAGDDTLAGFNVNTIALQVPKTDVAAGRDPATNNVVGVWSTAWRRSTRVQRSNGSQSYRRRFVRVSRLGNPLVNEVVIPLKDKDYWNASRPLDDGAFLPYVNDPILARTIEAVYGIPAPDSNPNKPGIQRGDLISVFLKGLDGLNRPDSVRPSEEMRLNLTTPPCEPMTCPDYSRLGVIGGDNAGYPNGRRLADDVIDISVQVMEGELIGNPNDLSDGVDANDVAFDTTFPYVALPHRGSDAAPH